MFVTYITHYISSLFSLYFTKKMIFTAIFFTMNFYHEFTRIFHHPPFTNFLRRFYEIFTKNFYETFTKILRRFPTTPSPQDPHRHLNLDPKFLPEK